MTVICDMAWRQDVPDEWRKAVLFHFTKVKEIKTSVTAIGVLTY